VPTTAEQSYTFVVNFLSVNAPTDTPAEQNIGFNLDHRDTGADVIASPVNCEDAQTDYIGVAPDSQIGVDNQLGNLLTIAGAALPACAGMMAGEDKVDCLLRSQIAQGSVLLLVSISGVNDLTYDDSVSVQLALGAATADADPGMDGNQPMVGTDGRLTAGQTFMSRMNIGPAATGDIYNGRLRIQTPTFAITLPVMGMTVVLPVTNAEIRFNISATGLSSGILGGAVQLAQVAELVNSFQPGPECSASMPCTGGATCRADGHCPSSLEGTVYDVGGGMTDIDPCTAAADCPWDGATTDGQTCTKLSLGLRLEATTATIQ